MARKKGLTSIQMSKLYKKLRKKGYSKPSAFKTTGVAKAISKNKFNSAWKKGKKGKYRNLDFDGDGKVNKYDCKPFNKYRQDKYNFENITTPAQKFKAERSLKEQDDFKRKLDTDFKGDVYSDKGKGLKTYTNTSFIPLEHFHQDEKLKYHEKKLKKIDDELFQQKLYRSGLDKELKKVSGKGKKLIAIRKKQLKGEKLTPKDYHFLNRYRRKLI